MEGPWDKPNTDSEPGKARWMAKGNPEETPHKRDSNSCEGMTLSPSMCLSTCALFLLINNFLPSLLSISMRKFTSTHLMGQGLATGHWSLVTGGLVVRIQHSHCHGLTSVSDPEPKPCFKLLQAKAITEQQSQSLSYTQLFATPWTVACQAPLSMEFSRPEYWSGQLVPSPGNFPSQGSNPVLLQCRRILYCLSHQSNSTQKSFGPTVDAQWRFRKESHEFMF